MARRSKHLELTSDAVAVARSAPAEDLLNDFTSRIIKRMRAMVENARREERSEPGAGLAYISMEVECMAMRAAAIRRKVNRPTRA